MAKTKLQVMAEWAVDGDEEALKYLQLQQVNVAGNKPLTLTLTWENLCSDYHYVGHVFVVAAKLGLNTLRRTLRMSLQHMSFIAQHHFQRQFSEISTTCTIETVAEILSMMLLDVPPPRLNRSEDYDSETTSEGEPEPKKKNRKITEKNEKSPKITKTQKKNQKDAAIT